MIKTLTDRPTLALRFIEPQDRRAPAARPLPRDVTMPIPVTCPSCQTTLKAPDHAAGRQVKCPRCGTAFPVPHSEEPPPMAVVPAGSLPPPVPGAAPPPPRPSDDRYD